MKLSSIVAVTLALILVGCQSPVQQGAPSALSTARAVSNIVAQHGQLKVVGNKIVDASGSPIQLKGMSMFWSQWSTPFWNAQAINTLASGWGSTLVRAAMGAQSGTGGYLENPTQAVSQVTTVVDAAIAAGIYVIIDWHEEQAVQHTSQAAAFFTQMAQKYGKTPNVMFEIYNEPNGPTWPQIKSYAETVISAIRGTGSTNLIIVGTPTWSQDVDIASQNPITSSSNIAYTLHFYAGTHKQFLRDKANTALANGIALFVTEWGTCDASGNSGLDLAESQTWIDWMAQKGISWANWSLNDKAETASALNPGTSPTGPWPNSVLTPSGAFVVPRIPLANQPSPSPIASPTPSTSPNPPTETPYTSAFSLGTSTTIPAGEYNKGGEGVAYHDTDAANQGGAFRTDGVDLEASADGGYNIGWTQPGEWVDYFISSGGAWLYDFNLRVAALNSGASIHLELNGQNVTGAISVPSTGAWQTYTTITKRLSVPAGQSKLRVVFDAAGSNLSKIVVNAVPDATPSPTPTPSPSPVPSPSPTPTVSPSPQPGNVVVTYTKNDWGSGFTGTIVIKNNGTSAINNWTLKFAYAGNQTITQYWSATVVQSGKNVTVTPLSYNATIPAGGSINFGFNANYSGSNVDPTAFTVTY